MSDQNDEQDTGGTTAEDMGGATGITGGGKSGRPGEGVKGGAHEHEREQGESQGAGAADLNAGQPSIQDDQPEADAGRSASTGSPETGVA